MSNRIRKAIKSAPIELAARWQSHGTNLPVLNGARPTPRQAEVSVSARQSRQIRKISAPLTEIVDMATVSPQTRIGRTQVTNTIHLRPRTGRDHDRGNVIGIVSAMTEV